MPLQPHPHHGQHLHGGGAANPGSGSSGQNNNGSPAPQQLEQRKFDHGVAKTNKKVVKSRRVFRKIVCSS